MQPSVGGEVSQRLRALRTAVAAERGRLAAERVSLPTVAEFYAGRAVLITGGSGFLGRMVIEMLLRCCPDIGRIFLVLRDKRGVPAADRLRDLLDAPLFDKVRVVLWESLKDFHMQLCPKNFQVSSYHFLYFQRKIGNFKF